MKEFIFTPAAVNDPMNHPRRIYFSCHTDDQCYFHSIAEQIRGIEKDCVIAYASPDGDENLRLEQLEDFHLIVIPITDKWFTEGSHTREFDRVTAAHKAILPIIFDNQLSDRFRHSTDKLQYLRFSDPDFTEKLRRTLQDILFDSKLLKQVESVFTHKMFVSYCREDAEQAKHLIRSLHSIESGKRISIWYDKYLPMGKNFEDSIFAELDDSNFLAVTLTPSLLNRENYVKRYEYPHAHTQKKPIIFFELSQVDRAKLLGQLEGAEEYDCISLDDPKAFAAFVGQLLQRTPARKNISLNPTEINYRLGLAYQNGLFVEFDHAYAAQKFKDAANAQHAEAAHALANMFYHGAGIPRDVEKAISWYKKEIRITEKTLAFCVQQLCRVKEVPLVVFNPVTNQVEGPTTKSMDQLQEIINTVRNLADSLVERCCNNAHIFRDEGKIDGAVQLYRIALKSLDLIDSVANRLEVGKKHRQSIENEMNQLLLIVHKSDNNQVEKTWLSCKSAYIQRPNAKHLYDLMLSADNYGVSLTQNGQLAEGQNIMQYALSERAKHINEPSSPYYNVIHGIEIILLRHLGVSYLTEQAATDIERNHNGHQALAILEESLRVAEDTNFDFEADPYLYTKAPQILLHIADAYQYMGDHYEAYSHYWKAMSRMIESETALGAQVDEQDFPIILLEFYAQCLSNIAGYKDLPNLSKLCKMAEYLIHRFSKFQFVGAHIAMAQDSMRKLEDTLAFWRSVSEGDSPV